MVKPTSNPAAGAPDRPPLHLLEDEPLPPLPTAERLLSPPVRRPGELHEPVSLPAGARRALDAQIADHRLDPAVAAALLLEATSLIRQLEALAVSRPRLLLDAAAKHARLTRRTSAAEADYLRTLTRPPRSTPHQAVPATVAIPIRLLARLQRTNLAEAFNSIPLPSAAGWELAALATGTTMSEWGLATALAARPEGYEPCPSAATSVASPGSSSASNSAS